MAELFAGKLIEVDFEDRQIEAIVIDPNGLGEGKPSIGLGLRMTERHMGIDHSVLSRWIQKEGGASTICTTLKTPSGKPFTLVQIVDENNNEQLAIEASDWMALASDVLKHPGRVKKETQHKLIDFMSWYAVKGFYASTYAQAFGAYTKDDDSLVSQLQNKIYQLQELTDTLSNELALSERLRDRQQYAIDELKRDMSWHRMNSW